MKRFSFGQQNHKVTLIITCLLIFKGISGCENNPIVRLQNISEIRPLEDEQIIQQLNAEQSTLNLCEKANHIVSEDNTTIYQLEDTKYLVQIICFLGAYQGSYQFFLYSINGGNHQINLLDFITFEDTNNGLNIVETNLLTGYPEFDSDSKKLTIDRKARGLGDCGSYALYQWKTHDFQLTEYRYKGECDGVYLPVEEYPIIYP